MSIQRILITGGAGFVGSNLALRLRELSPAPKVVAVDNLLRRGSALNLPRLEAAGVNFLHADIRHAIDMLELPDFDLLIDAAAEPSVQAGMQGSPRTVLETNLAGTINILEAVRERKAALLFLSTSRVYSIDALNNIPYDEGKTRFAWQSLPNVVGLSEHGIAEEFSIGTPRSYYGTTKLASELLIQEYVAQTGMRALINRCGVLAGPWQMGKTDQGVVSLWMAHHFFNRPLSYLGFGGEGRQVRDVLHIDDVFDLLVRQIENINAWNGEIYNVGGGLEGSVSLHELTELCREATGNTLEIGSSDHTSPVDVRIYFTDARRVQQAYDWRPQQDPTSIVDSIAGWLAANQQELEPVLGK